jgi:hypothetical protein
MAFPLRTTHARSPAPSTAVPTACSRFAGSARSSFDLLSVAGRDHDLVLHARSSATTPPGAPGSTSGASSAKRTPARRRPRARRGRAVGRAPSGALNHGNSHVGRRATNGAGADPCRGPTLLARLRAPAGPPVDWFGRTHELLGPDRATAARRDPRARRPAEGAAPSQAPVAVPRARSAGRRRRRGHLRRPGPRPAALGLVRAADRLRRPARRPEPCRGLRRRDASRAARLPRLRRRRPSRVGTAPRNRAGLFRTRP